jgi:fructose-bisphosphate aldolase class II/tagatose 1,6-diphosphate aldolase GatY/KbaY
LDNPGWLMLAQGTSMLTEAAASGTAVAAITTYTLESTRAVCLAAERAGRPVLLQAGSSSFGAVGLDLLAAAALTAAEHAAIPVGVHLDHATDPGEIARCIELGYTSVMVDGSHLPFEANVALTRQVVERAHAVGVWVEGELGALAGDEDATTNAQASEFTDPEQAAEFAARTGVDALAVAVGNVHGFTAEPVRLDLDRLRTIASRTPVPLVLHGASGLADADVLGAVAAGVVKVNLNAELRRAHVDALRAALDHPGDDVRALQKAAIQAMARVAEQKIRLLAGQR